MEKMNINNLPNVVKLTLGPKGKNIILNDGRITKDGVSVAKSFIAEDAPTEIIRQASLKTLEDVGDGTTSSTVLAQAIYNHLSDKDYHKISNQFEAETKIIKKYISENSNKINSKKDLYNIANVSSNWDKEISKTVSDICHKIGAHGDVNLEFSPKKKTEYEIENGFLIKDGPVSSSLIMDDSEVFENPIVLLARDKIAGITQISAVTEKCVKESVPFIVICNEIDIDVISTFALTRLESKGSKAICIVSTKDIDNKFKNLSMLLDAKIVDNNAGRSAFDIDSSWLGTCKRIIISKGKTTIVHGKEEKSLPKDSHITKKEWKKIISKVANIKVGGDSRVESSEKLDRYDDALRSTMSSFEQGYNIGGGVIFLRASTKCKLLKKPLQSLFRQMCENAGYGKIKTNYLIYKLIKDESLIYDFREEKFKDYKEANIYDSTKVLQITLESGTSISKMLLTTGYVMEQKK